MQCFVMDTVADDLSLPPEVQERLGGWVAVVKEAKCMDRHAGAARTRRWVFSYLKMNGVFFPSKNEK